MDNLDTLALCMSRLCPLADPKVWIICDIANYERKSVLLPLQVPGQSAVRFFVASQGPVDPPAGGFLTRPAHLQRFAYHAVCS